MTFEYNEAFRRNIGWVSTDEQAKLQKATIAIGGLGGVGGDHAITLARLGVENFSIADFDTFDYSNFNRQSGATVNTIGKSKIDVTEQLMLDINPNIKVKKFSMGLTRDNLNDFLDGVNIYVDSLDLFALDIRRAVFHSCDDMGIPALTTAPMGMGAAFLSFLPGKGMSFEQYFGMSDPTTLDLQSVEGSPVEEYMLHLDHYIDNIVRFIIGLSPSFQQRKYLVDKTKVNLFTKDVPSLKMGIDLTAGGLCTNVLKIILNRGEVVCAPRGLHFDAYRNKYIKTRCSGGAKNIKLRLMRMYLRKLLCIEEQSKIIRGELHKQLDAGTFKNAYTEEDMLQMLMQHSA